MQSVSARPALDKHKLVTWNGLEVEKYKLEVLAFLDKRGKRDEAAWMRRMELIWRMNFHDFMGWISFTNKSELYGDNSGPTGATLF